MTPWLNAAALVVATALFFALYVASVRPAALAQRLGQRAYRRCGWYRAGAMLFEFITVATYAVYKRYPLPLDLPDKLPWPYGLSVALALAIGVPATWLMVRGMLDAGKEAAVPQPDQTLYEGIYRRVRHPQAAGEVWLWLVIALLLHSPFLALYSLVWFPLFYVMSLAEERDLVRRFGNAYVAYRERTGMFWPRRNR